MKKNFTFILLSLLLFVVGGAKVCAQTTTLVLDKTNNVSLSDQVYTDGKVTGATATFNGTDFNGTWSTGLTGADNSWVANYQEGEVHTFTINLSEGAPAGIHFCVAADYFGNFNDNKATKYLNETIPEGATSVSYSVSSTTHPDLLSNEKGKGAYQYVWIINQGTYGAKLKISSITRTISTASSVDVPTITPADGTTYDGELSVTIAKGDDNTRVVYSVSGATVGNVTNAEFTSDELTAGSKVLNLTGTGTITVTATGYDDGNNASSEVTNTYTFGIPDGKETATVTYYQIVPLTMSGGTTPAYFDFEDGTTLITGTSNIDSDKLSIVDCDTSHETSTGSSKCMKVDLTDKKDGSSSFYNVQVQLIFNSALEQNKQYQVHYWTKADTYVNNETYVRFQADGNNGWTEYNKKGIEYGTDWTEYSYAISVNGNNCTMMVFDLGKVLANTIYLDDVVVYDVTDGNTPVEFTSKLKTAVVSASAFNDFAAGDYICLNITGTPTEIAYKEHAANDETAISNYPSYTDLEQTNGNWLIPVTSDIKNNGLSIKGYNMTLNSVDIYKKEALSEAEDNTISSKENNVVVELTRSFVKDTWNTVCLPFALTSAQATQLFGEGYQLAEFTSVSGSTMEFTTTGTFEAGVPYLVKPTKTVNNDNPVVLVDVDITAKTPQTVPPLDGYSFTGTFTTKSFASDDWATTRFVATGNKLNTPNSPNAMKALRCYFTVPAGSSARGYAIDGFMDDDVPTDISATLNDNVQTTKVIYNLAGQRVANPTKGLYIVNGQKVVVK